VLLFAGAGVLGGSLAASLAAYRIHFIAISVALLAAAYYLIYFKKWGARWNRWVLWLATALTAFFWLLPDLMRYLK
jgi:hypothetical protein